MKMIHFPKTRLSELAKRAGGISRDDAVEGAMQQMESLRGESDDVIETTIAALEAIGQTARKNGKCSRDQLLEILQHGDQMVTLAGTFGYGPLGIASRSLCDIADGMMRAGSDDIAPILVHVQAVRMTSPRSAALTPEQADKVLAELTRVLTHFNFSPISDAADKNNFGEMDGVVLI
jgi:hypothetical protein